MPSNDRGSSPDVALWGFGITLVILIASTAMAGGRPPYLFIGLASLMLGRMRSRARDEESVDEVPFRPAVSSPRWTPVRPQSPDKGHPLWDRWLDG